MKLPHLFLWFACWLTLPSGAGAAEEKIVLQLKWKHQFQFAGYYAAIEKGYYREAGLEVELLEAVPGQDPVEAVLHGRAQFGISTSNLVIQRALGEPVVVLAVIYQHSPFVVLTAVQSGIRDIHEVAKHPLMMEPDAGELLAYFKNEGVDPASLQLIPHTFNALDLLHTKSGAMSAYSTDEPFHLKAAGVEYLVFTPRASGIDFYGDNLFTTEAHLASHPEQTRAFVAASLRGWEYAMAHPEEIVEVILSKYSKDKTREQLLFEAQESARLIHPELIEIGYINPGRWQSIVQTYKDLGMIEESFSMEGFLLEGERPLDLRWLYWLGGGSLAVGAGAFGWSLLVARMNRRLRSEVEARTRAEQEARSQSEAKTRLLATLAHEVRSPLSGVIGALDCYRYREDEQGRQEMVDAAEASATSLLQMLDNLLNHSRMESGSVELDAAPFSPRALVAEMEQLFRAAVILNAVELKVEIAPGVPEKVVADVTLVRQILSNLISNAVKFSGGGLLRLGVEADAPGAGRRQLRFRVADSGPGLTPEAMGRIFEPYRQADASIARRYGGSGLGLAISSQFARLLGGEITVESRPGEGAAFTFQITAEEGPQITGF